MSSNAGKPQIPNDMKAFSDNVIAEFRTNRGELSGPMAGALTSREIPIVVLEPM